MQNKSSGVLAQEVLTQRERNQRDTWNAIHDAAYAFARDEGLSAATVEAVVARAGVSRRTFFNYFPTKEDAVLGARLPRLDDDVVDRLAAEEEDELTRVVYAFVAVMRTSLTRETAVRRREIVTQHPSLRGRLAQLVAQVEELVREAAQRAAERRHAGPDQAGRYDGNDESSLEVLLMLAGVITKHAFTRYYERQDCAAGELDAGVEAVLEESIAQFRHAVRRSDTQREASDER